MCPRNDGNDVCGGKQPRGQRPEDPLRTPRIVAGPSSLERASLTGARGRGCIGVVGEEVKAATFSGAQRRDYRRKVQLSLDVFETMLAQSSFEFERPLTGMEIECNLVDEQYQPAMENREVLAAIADPKFQTELGAYNIEFN